MVKVSVVIPAFNPGRFLMSALQSVVAQNFLDWEAIVVDDGSSEDLSWVSTIDGRIRCHVQKNQGQAVARNTGLKCASGEYIAFLDQDDLWERTKLQQQTELLDGDPKMVACHTQFELIDSEGKVRGPGYGRHQSYAQMLEGCGICGSSSVMVRAKSLKGCGVFNDQDRPAEDMDLWLRLARVGEFGFIGQTLVQYRVHGNNQSFRYRQTFSAISRIQRRQIALAPEQRTYALSGLRNYRRDAAGKAFDQMRTALRKRSWREAAGHGSFILRHEPALFSTAIVSRLRKP